MLDDLLIIFPGALGDFLCLRPTLHALRQRVTGRVWVVARREVFPLLPRERFTGISIDRREVADLFATAPLAPETRAVFSGFAQVHSWTAHGDANFARRLAEATSATVHVHPFRRMAAAEHAAHYFARSAGVEMIEAPFEPAPDATRWADEFFAAHALGPRTLVIHPGSGSARKNWTGMDTIAARWRQEGSSHVVIVRGPAEESAPPTCVHEGELCGQPLDRVAALLQRAHRYLGNDSGVSHLAGAVGSAGVVLFGPTDPQSWRPLGDRLHLLTAPSPCATCGPDRFCAHRLTPERVWQALRTRDPLRA